MIIDISFSKSINAFHYKSSPDKVGTHLNVNDFITLKWKS